MNTNTESLLERIGNPADKHNPILVWRRGDYCSVAVKSALSYDVDHEHGEESTDIPSIADVFGDGDGGEWWNSPMTDEEFRNLMDCTIFA